MDNRTRPNIWAHRGGRRWADPTPPENSLAAFKKCLEAGIYGIELDVQKCKSGELVVLHGGVHGGDLAETTDGEGLLKDKTWDELKAVRLLKPGSQDASDERIPLLSEVFELVGGRCMLNIEIKNQPWPYEGIADDLIAMIEKYKAADTVVLSSFDHGVLKAIHGKAPDLKLGLLINGLLVDVGEYAEKVGCRFWHPYLGALTTAAAEEAHMAGLKINTWTATTADEFDLALKLGADGIVTDDPAALAGHLDKVLAAKQA